VFPLTPIIIVPIIVALEQVVMPVILNPPNQFALVIMLELILIVLVQFVLIILLSVFRMRSVMSQFLLLLGVSLNTPIVIFIVILVIVLCRMILHITLHVNVQTANLQIIVHHLVEMIIATIRKSV